VEILLHEAKAWSFCFHHFQTQISHYILVQALQKANGKMRLDISDHDAEDPNRRKEGRKGGREEERKGRMEGRRKEGWREVGKEGGRKAGRQGSWVWPS
jgi:hypothetical protein